MQPLEILVLVLLFLYSLSSYLISLSLDFLTIVTELSASACVGSSNPQNDPVGHILSPDVDIDDLEQ